MATTLLATTVLMGCGSSARDLGTPPVRTGAGVLLDRGFDLLAGKRVGLITNQTGRVDSLHLIDLLASAPNVELIALFGPEHGLRGNAEAGAPVAHGKDDATGVPVYSLYGASNAPPDSVISALDVLVFDIQDIGVRFYTYITTMGRAMQTAARARIPFIVLDRPNPLGGESVEGYVLDEAFKSGVGPYPIPIRHGMTVGELAKMIKGEAYLESLDDLDLTVVSMTGWTRNMLWPDTGLPWVATSPNIPTFETALVYAGTVFFEALSASEGRGTPAPFLTLGAPWLDSEAAVHSLQAESLRGVTFSRGSVTPQSIPSVAIHPEFEGRSIETIQIHVDDIETYESLRTGLAVLKTVIDLAPDSAKTGLVDRRWMGLISGSDGLADALESGKSSAEIVSSWAGEVAAFRARAAPYLLYK